MSDITDQLVEALRERLAIVADHVSRHQPDQHLQRLQAISERIDALKMQLPPPLDPQLAHYLDRASYSKALAFLEDARPGG